MSVALVVHGGADGGVAAVVVVVALVAGNANLEDDGSHLLVRGIWSLVGPRIMENEDDRRIGEPLVQRMINCTNLRVMISSLN